MLCKDCTIKVLCVASVAVNSSAIQLFLVYPVCWVLFTLNDVTVLDSRQMFSAHGRFIGGLVGPSVSKHLYLYNFYFDISDPQFRQILFCLCFYL